MCIRDSSRSEFSLIENATGAVHALAMAVWLGGLILLTRVVLAGPGEEDLVHAVRGFARIATPALWATVVTGAIQLFQLDRGALDTDHGLVVIVKALFVSVMVFVGVAARQFISQRVSRVDSMTAPLATRLRRALGIEALIGVLVLALTSWLLALTPPGLVADGSSGSLQLGAVHSFQNAAAGAEVTVAFSERVGANDVRIEVLSPATGLTGLTIDFIPPVNTFVNGMTINSIPLVGPGAAVLQKSDGFTLLASGTWTLIVSANGAELARQDVFVAGDSADATTPIASLSPLPAAPAGTTYVGFSVRLNALTLDGAVQVEMDTRVEPGADRDMDLRNTVSMSVANPLSSYFYEGDATGIGAVRAGISGTSYASINASGSGIRYANGSFGAYALDPNIAYPTYTQVLPAGYKVAGDSLNSIVVNDAEGRANRSHYDIEFVPEYPATGTPALVRFTPLPGTPAVPADPSQGWPYVSVRITLERTWGNQYGALYTESYSSVTGDTGGQMANCLQYSPFVVGDPRDLDGCLLYTSDAADDLPCVDLGGRRIIKKKNHTHTILTT